MKLRMQITKESGIRFISHLEYQRTIEKAIRRAGIPVEYSQGFNPQMRFSLATALGVGIVSLCQFAEIKLAATWQEEGWTLEKLLQALQQALPMGIHVLKGALTDDHAPKLMAVAQGAAYEVLVPCTVNPEGGLTQFNATEEVPFTKPHKKGKGAPKSINVKAYIPKVAGIWAQGRLTLCFDIAITPTGSMKALELLQVLRDQFGVPLVIEQADIRQKELYGKDAKGQKTDLIGA